jgi:hypothetical protein
VVEVAVRSYAFVAPVKGVPNRMWRRVGLQLFGLHREAKFMLEIPIHQLALCIPHLCRITIYQCVAEAFIYHLKNEGHVASLGHARYSLPVEPIYISIACQGVFSTYDSTNSRKPKTKLR